MVRWWKEEPFIILIWIVRFQVSRTNKGGDAIMAIGVDNRPKTSLKEAISAIPGVQESVLISE